VKEATIVGIDLAKNIFWAHGADRSGRKLFSKKIARKDLLQFTVQLPRCIIAMEACGSSQFWARRFKDQGHEVKLVAAQHVKPFVKSNKNDANDAEAIVEAASRPQMRFVPLKTIEQQDTLSLHRVRERLVRSRTALINEIRGLLSEYGLIIPQGASKVRERLPQLTEDVESTLSIRARELFSELQDELRSLDVRIKTMDDKIKWVAKSSEAVQRLIEIPGVGILSATAIVASVGNANVFSGSRELSAWLGLVPRQHSSGGKQKLGGISKRGDKYLRKLLIHGARSVVCRADGKSDPESLWVKALLERRGFNKTCVAVANKNARKICAMLRSGADYKVAS
jgi:transposase